MKALRYILYGLLAAAVIGLVAYQAFITKNLESRNLVKAALLLAGILLSLLRPRKTRYVGSKKTLYQKAYGEFIQGAFADDARLEKKFYSALHDYNNSKPQAGVKKLMVLRKECQRTAENISTPTPTQTTPQYFQTPPSASPAWPSRPQARRHGLSF